MAQPAAAARYLKPETRPSPTLVLGETHQHTTPGRAPQPIWLAVRERNLHTGRQD
jgi:hypothetical protein